MSSNYPYQAIGFPRDNGIYNGLRRKAVTRIPCYTEFLIGSGHTASYAVKAPKDKTMLEEIGLISAASVTAKTAAYIREMDERHADWVTRHAGMDQEAA